MEICIYDSLGQNPLIKKEIKPVEMEWLYTEFTNNTFNKTLGMFLFLCRYK